VSRTADTDQLVSVGPPRGLIAGPRYSIRALWEHRQLLVLLVRREIKSRYKDSGLGFLWSLARPLVQLLIYYFAVGQFLGAARSIPEFAIFILTGLTAWGLFSEILTSSTTSIVANSGLIKKVYLPREIFPLSAIGSSLFNFVIQFAILIGATVVLGQFALSPELALVPAALIVLILLGLALGLFLSAINVYLRDVQHLVEVFLLVFFWASPIVYSYQMVHESPLGGGLLEQIYLWNPVTVIVLCFQQGLWSAGSALVWPPDLAVRLAVIGVISLVLVWIAQRIFARLEGNFAQEL
jgi:ABC-2 type transport system permease protein